MEIALSNVLICGVRKLGKDEKPFYLVDWYKDGPYSSFLEAEKLDAYKALVFKGVNLKVRIEERNGKVNYRILEVVPIQVGKA